MCPSRYGFSPEENDTAPGCAPSTRPPSRASAERRAISDFNDPPTSWRPRPRLESTTYSIVPGAREKSTGAPPASVSGPKQADISAPSATNDHDALSVAQCREIDAMYASITTLSHYELLGVQSTAEPATLRANHQALLSVFHAARFAQKQLGPYRRKLEIIVQCVNDAYATLSDPDLRAIYDERLTSEGDGRR